MDLGRLFEYRWWRAFLEPDIWLFLLDGLRATLTIALPSIVLSLILGTLLALARLSPFRPLAWPSGLYVEVGSTKGTFDYAYTEGGNLESVHRMSLGVRF